MGVFHVFKIVQMVPNRATHHISGEIEVNRWNSVDIRSEICRGFFADAVTPPLLSISQEYRFS